ncbi:MAG: PaaI family thioesterase [Coriobacteriia bacterium]|nr:PaaI family thioesterase [Coriobacteriia bacterium]
MKKAQDLSRMCLICGEDNHAGLHGQFLETEEGDLIGIFTATDEHQSYPERAHGGISSAILDELIGRAIWMLDDTIWGVTIDLTLKYRQPVPVDCKVYGRARITENRSRLFAGTGEILLSDGTVAVEATGRYLKLAPDAITPDLHAADIMCADPRPWPETIKFGEDR